MALKVTTKEIAQICGVSIGTVDRALHNRVGINPGTRQRILTVAEQLGYRPHLLARGLVTGSTMTIGVVVSNLVNPFFSELVEVIQRKARHAGYHVYLMLDEFVQREEEYSLDRLRGLNVDGIITVPISRGNAFVAFLKRLATSVVTISNRVSKNWPWIGIDDRAAVRDSVRFVISKGYERILFVTQSRDPGAVQTLYVDEQRLLGYKDALHETERAIQPEVFADKAIYQFIDQDHEFFSRRTCVVCSCDAIALDLMNKLSEHAIRIPQQVGLMGFDNLDVLKYVTPRLATISYSIQQIGEAAFDTLISGLNGKPMESRTLSYSIIPGETV